MINVIPGKRYRFRLLSLACEPNYVFSIDGHDMTVIEADGVNTQPLVVDSVRIFTGQRYSVVLEATQAIDNYWIRANPNFGHTGFENGINSAILRYVGASVEEPSTALTKSAKPLKETDLHPLDPMPVVRSCKVHMMESDSGLTHWYPSLANPSMEVLTWPSIWCSAS